MNVLERKTQPNFALLLLLSTGLFFIACALIYHPDLLNKMDPIPAVADVSDKITQARLTFLGLGLALLVLGGLGGRAIGLSAWLRNQTVTNIVLALLTIAVPITFLELALKPFASSEATTIFTRDESLGWRLQPNAEGTWGGVPVKINGKGLRGPELPYEKPVDTSRILYLGDSVTFGFLIADDQATFPHQVGQILEARLSQPIETVNAGVGGYSPWQEYRYFAAEGLNYQPDLVIVSFVLNDVTEKFELLQFGGFWEGYQVTHTAFSQFDYWASRSSILYFLKQAGVALRNRQQGAALIQESLDVDMLALQPDNPDVQTAWQITLENLGAIFELAADRDIPVALVIFPYTFQFEDVQASAAPQQGLTQYAVSQDIPVLDLLPLLSESMAVEGVAPSAYFLDDNHLSPLGASVVAEMIVAFSTLR